MTFPIRLWPRHGSYLHPTEGRNNWKLAVGISAQGNLSRRLLPADFVLRWRPRVNLPSALRGAASTTGGAESWPRRYDGCQAKDYRHRIPRWRAARLKARKLTYRPYPETNSIPPIVSLFSPIHDFPSRASHRPSSSSKKPSQFWRTQPSLKSVSCSGVPRSCSILVQNLLDRFPL